MHWSIDHRIDTPTGPCGTTGRPGLAVFQGKVFCVHQGRANSGWLWCTTYDGKSWSADQMIPNSLDAFGISGTPALIAFPEHNPTRLYCIREGRNNCGWTYCASTTDGETWSADQLLPNPADCFGTSGAPGLAVFNGRLYCARSGQHGSGWVWCSSSADGVNWTPDALLPDATDAFGISGSPALAVFQGKLWCIRQGRSDSGWLWGASTTDGRNWTPDSLVPDANTAIGLSGSPAVVEFNSNLYCLHEGRNNDGWVWGASSPDGVNWTTDSLLPDSSNPMGTTGGPAVCTFRSAYADGPELLCVHEGRGGSGDLWISTFSEPWIGRHYARLKTKRLDQLCLPGSHDSGAYDLAGVAIDSQAPNSQVLNLWNGNGPGIRAGIQRFSETQDLDIAAQLRAGIRYFDFRAALNDATFCLAHFVVGADLGVALASIKDFLDANTREIVIIKSRWLGDSTGKAAYLQAVQAAMGNYFQFLSTGTLTQTLEAIVNSGQRFLFSDEGACINTTSYSNSSQPQTARNILPLLEQNWRNGPFSGSLWEVQFVARPSDQTYITGVISGMMGGLIPVENSLRDVANALVSDRLMPDYFAWVSQQPQQKALNLLIADFCEDSGVVQQAIALSLA